MSQSRPIYCPFCDKGNPIIEIIARGDGVVMTKNMAPRQPCSNVLFPESSHGQHYGSFMEMPEHLWLELILLHARYIADNPGLFLSGGKPTWRLVFNHTAPGSRSPAGRQSVFHVHGQQFGPGEEGGSLGRFAIVEGYPKNEVSPQFRELIDTNQAGDWTYYRNIPARVAPVDFLLLPPRNYPGFIEGGPQVLLNLHTVLRGLVAAYPAAFREGGRLIFNAGEGALQLSRHRPFEVRLVGGTGLDLARYTEYDGRLTLPDPALMAEGDAALNARAAQLDQMYVNWWVHTTSGASA